MSPFEAEPLMLFDRRAHRLHRERAARLGGANFLHALAAGWLADRLDDIARPFGAALVFGAQDGVLSRTLTQRSGTEWVVTADPCLPFLRRHRGMRVVVDPELVPFRNASFDLAVSALTLHWVADLPGTLAQLRRVLKPDGLFLAAMLGGSTLAELRTALIEAELDEEGGASPRVSPMANLADLASLLQRAGFAMPVADTDKIVVTYPDLLALMRELRGMGETNALSARRRTPLRRITLARAAAFYAERHGREDGRIAATFEVLCLTGWAPDAAQPKPLPPGSATYRLADALGTEEMAAGDRVPLIGRRGRPQSPKS